MLRFDFSPVARRWKACHRASVQFQASHRMRPFWGTTRVIAEQPGYCVVELGFNNGKKPHGRMHYAVPDDREGEIRELTFHDVEKYGVELWL
jgi:hypothetical protein